MAWKPSWKPATARSDGHLIELGLVVAGDAGVAGVVGVGGVEGGGAGAERAVHEALEHGGVEEGIALWVGGLALLEGLDGGVEGQPLGYAEVEFAGFFEGFEGRGSLPSRRGPARR